ncbi:hypothetical protein KI372_02945 [Halobacterium salinarum]|uniref:hypothetical protein n=1 Tax=Halobacterium salinarum TaxID=2242 RepID=UPI001F38B256|nr:hypothetical protein [Halobacterium salinarum]MCF2208161.1 hypothetical protein [Halobacterium salinarum]MCF2240394.1 hypothetical protein [Halobacterium salinarum]
MRLYFHSKMPFPSTEVRLIATFKQGLKQAVSDIDGYSWDDVDSITEQKLLLMAIRDHDLDSEVTIQWYADGDMLPELDHGIENAGELAIRDEEGPYPAVQQVAEYYIATEENSESLPTEMSITEVINAETFSWLREYYDQRDGPFQDLYLANIDTHLHLYQCAKACDPEAAVEDFPENLIQPLSERTSEMKRELLRFQVFAGLESYVTQFTKVAETVLDECANRGVAEMDQEQRSEYQKLLQHLDTFYYHGLWKQITRLIAVHTVSGPEDYFERAANWGRVEKTKEKFVEVFSEFAETASEYDIDVDIKEDQLPEVWINRESITKEEFLDWELGQSLPKDAVSSVPEDDPVYDLVG